MNTSIARRRSAAPKPSTTRRAAAQAIADAIDLGHLPKEMTREMPDGVSVRRAARQFLR